MKNLKYILSFTIIFSIVSCETEIPDEDDTIPRFTFRINGDGFDRTFDNDDDYENIQLNIKQGQEYDFILTGGDDGGVELIRWVLPTSDYIEFTSTINEPWQVDVSGLTRTIEWYGDPNNPVTGNLLAGTFEPIGENVSITFRFYVLDFGGDSGTSNTISKELSIYIGNHDTEIIQF